MKNLMRCASFAVLLALWVPAQTLAQAQPQQPPGDTAQPDGDTEEIIVTGSFIKGTPEDAALPVTVIDSEELTLQGTPSIAEFLRDNPITQGLIAETNQFDTRGGQGNEGATTINLRGLGSARTLVLINGRRHVADETIGVDVSMIPMLSVQRIEVLKDGAAALYGSDAIGGVVNFITRDEFEGLEIKGSHQWIEDTDGEFDVGIIAGYGGDNWNWTISGEYAERSELQVKDRNWAIRPFSENPQGGSSAIGNPGTIVDFTPTVGLFNPDPNCDALGGINDGTFCRFQFTFFDNLIEDTQTWKVLSTFNYEFGEHKLRIEGLFSQVSIDEWNTSPAYPPQSLLGPPNAILSDHPGRLDFFAQNPAYGALFDPGEALFFWGRYVGSTGFFGEPQDGIRETEQYRFGASLKGTLFDGALDYDIGVTYSERERSLDQLNDMLVQNFAFALKGLGGPNCTPSTGTPGVGDCMYYNPFSNAIERSVINGAVNAQFNPAVANDPGLLRWLTDAGGFFTTNELLVFDAVVSGQSGFELPGGNISFAVGAQARNEEYELEVDNVYDLTQNPCPFNDPFAVTLGLTASLDCAGAETGLFAFISGTTPENLERTIYALFGELALPISDTIDVQLALRFEDYGGEVGTTLDPKIAARWQATEWLAFRGSASTTFRGPPQSALAGRVTNLVFINPTTAFKAVDTAGNPDLDPETALATNVGVLLNWQGFTGSIDWWRFDFEDPLQLEDPNQIAAAYITNDCADGGTGVGSSTCTALRGRIFPTGIAASQLQRIDRFVINGSDIVTSGIDVASQFVWDWQGVEWTVGGTATYTIEYDSDDFLTRDGLQVAQGGDFAGFLNEGTPFLSIVELRGNAFTRARFGPHTLTYTARYTDDYKDPSATLSGLETIDDHWTHDITYNLELFEGRTRINFSVFNLTDEDPPPAHLDLNYDPYTHNAFGRMFKVGLTQSF